MNLLLVLYSIFEISIELYPSFLTHHQKYLCSIQGNSILSILSTLANVEYLLIGNNTDIELGQLKSSLKLNTGINIISSLWYFDNKIFQTPKVFTIIILDRNLFFSSSDREKQLINPNNKDSSLDSDDIIYNHNYPQASVIACT